MTRVGSQRHSKKKLLQIVGRYLLKEKPIFAVFVLYVGLLT